MMNFFSLSRRWWWSHHLSFLVHDHMLNVLLRGQEKNLFELAIPFANEEESESFKVLDEDEDGDVVEWLRAHGRLDESQQVIERVIVHGLLSDMCQFLFESIECAAKGKMGVAFGLLRKPFRDQLFVLEWLLADRDGFITEFEKGPASISLEQLLNDRREWMKTIVRTATERSDFNEFLDSQFVWEVRFESSVHWSLQAMWNQALHLVTTRKHQSTERGSLNFTFVDDDERLELQGRYYQQIPSMLVYTLGVLNGIISRWDSKFVAISPLFELRMMANLELAVRETCEEVTDNFGVEAVNHALEAMSWTCEACSVEMRIKNPGDLELFAADGAVRCSRCSMVDGRIAALDWVDDDDDV